MVSEAFIKLIHDADGQPAVRGRLLYFPAEICELYGIEGDEREAVVRGDIAQLDVPGESRLLARMVFDTHDMFAGE